MASLMRSLIINGTKSASVERVAVPVPGRRQVVVDVLRAGEAGVPALSRSRVVRHGVRHRDRG
jgi:hypothetical protein